MRDRGDAQRTRFFQVAQKEQQRNRVRTARQGDEHTTTVAQQRMTAHSFAHPEDQWRHSQ
jgi:hypothetical protein